MSLLEVLRHKTRTQHEALHHHPLLRGLSDEGLTRADFDHILLAFDAYYRRAEAARKFAAPEGVPDAPVLAWLAADLERQGLEGLSGIEIDFQALDTPSKLAGYLYTKQGSTLGGHVISKHLERCLGLVPHRDQAFFAGYGAEPLTGNGARWKRFVAWLDGGDFDVDAAVMTAQLSFDAIAAACDRVVEMRQAPGRPPRFVHGAAHV